MFCAPEAGMVEKSVQVRYARRAKHVDIQQLKNGVLRELQGVSADLQQPAQFQEIVERLQPGDGGQICDLSVHLCFICLLHLANERSLVVKSMGGMADLVVMRES
jgi:condensin complex subunit 2